MKLNVSSQHHAESERSDDVDEHEDEGDDTDVDQAAFVGVHVIHHLCEASFEVVVFACRISGGLEAKSLIGRIQR